MNIPEDEIPKFQDPVYWLEYFPPRGREDLKSFGICADWRRSMITTSKNPYYDSFIRW
jgi:leucyl-tRNA synthetase